MSVLSVPPSEAVPWATSDEAAEFEERAAVREIEGGLSRWAAEWLAVVDVVAKRNS